MLLRNDVQNIRKIHALAMELSGRMQGTPLADLLATFDFGSVAVWEEHLVRGVALSRRLRSLALNVEWQYAARFYTAFTYYLREISTWRMARCRRPSAWRLSKDPTLFKGYCQLLLLRNPATEG